ncbi:MAG: phosphotransferase [Stackebrandtia sp.]
MLARLILISGAQAAGKTTIGNALARRLPRAVHIDGDAIQSFVVSGAVGMDVPPPPGAVEQLYLRYRGSLAVAQVYRDKGFDAVVTDNMFGVTFTDVIAMAHETGDVHVIMLDPGIESIMERDAARPFDAYTDTMTVRALADAVRETPRLGLWHDSSGETVTETTDRLLAKLDEAIVAPGT